MNSPDRSHPLPTPSHASDDAPLAPEDLLEEIVIAFVRNPSAVHVDLVLHEQHTELQIHVDPQDMGQIIGRSGRTIHTLQDLMNQLGGRLRRHFRVTVPANQNKGRTP